MWKNLKDEFLEDDWTSFGDWVREEPLGFIILAPIPIAVVAIVVYVCKLSGLFW